MLATQPLLHVSSRLAAKAAKNGREKATKEARFNGESS
jgi:hypothetical protein